MTIATNANLANPDAAKQIVELNTNVRAPLPAVADARPEDHRDWCENVLPEPLIRLSENPINGTYETDCSGTDLLWCAISCALSSPIETLRGALADGAEDVESKVRLAIDQLHQIEIDATNIRHVHEDGVSDSSRQHRRRTLDVVREIRLVSPGRLTALVDKLDEVGFEPGAMMAVLESEVQ